MVSDSGTKISSEVFLVASVAILLEPVRLVISNLEKCLLYASWDTA